MNKIITILCLGLTAQAFGGGYDLDCRAKLRNSQTLLFNREVGVLMSKQYSLPSMPKVEATLINRTSNSLVTRGEKLELQSQAGGALHTCQIEVLRETARATVSEVHGRCPRTPENAGRRGAGHKVERLFLDAVVSLDSVSQSAVLDCIETISWSGTCVYRND